MAAQAPLVLRTAAEADVETPGADRIGLFPKSDAAIPGEPHWIDDGGTVRSLQGTDGVLTYQNHGNTGASEDIDAGTNVHRLVFNAATVALTTSGWPASGTPGIVRLLLVQDGVGGRLADWSGITGLVWGAAGAPTLQTGAGEIDVVDLQSYDGGTTILGSYEITGATDAADITADTTGYGNSSASDVQGVLDDFDTAISAAGGGGSFDPDEHMPWRIDINPVLGPTVNTGFSLSNGGTNISEDQWADHGMTANAQNDELGFNVILAAGTWSVYLLFFRYTSGGIATVTFDASSVGTIDTYGASNQSNTVGSITGISVGATGKVALKLKASTKNGSSGGYALWLSWISLVRTA